MTRTDIGKNKEKFKKMIISNKNENWERRGEKVDSYLGGSRSTEAWRFNRNLRKENIYKVNLYIINIDQ